MHHQPPTLSRPADDRHERGRGQQDRVRPLTRRPSKSGAGN